MHKVLVLLPTFNSEKYLSELINSVLSQERIDLDLIIYDDGSKDGTLDLIDKFCEENNSISLIGRHKQRFGNPPESFNYLIHKTIETNYDYVALCDHDDIWHQNKLINAIEKIQELNVDGYSSDFYSYVPGKKSKYIKKSHKKTNWDFLFESPGPGCTFVMTKPLAKSYTEFIETQKIAFENFFFNHDWLIYAYARARNFRWFIDNNAYIDYRQHYENHIGVNLGMMGFLKRLDAIRRREYRKTTIKIIDNLGINTPFYNFLNSASYANNLRLLPHCLKFRRSKKDKLIFVLLLIMNLY